MFITIERPTYAHWIDDIEMFEYARYAIDPGENIIDLKDLRIIHPRILDSEGRPFAYQAGIRVFAAGFDEMIPEIEEMLQRIGFEM